MVIQSEVVYPGYGYPRQSYVTYQQQSWYTTDGHHNNNGYGMHPKPGPYFTTTPRHSNHHTNFDSTHSPQHEGFHGENKHQNGGYGTNQYYNDGSSGQALPYNCNVDSTSPYPYFTTTPHHSNHHTNFDSTGHSPQHEGCHRENKHQNGRYGTSQYYNDGSSGHALPYNCNDTSPYPYNNKHTNGAEKTEYQTYHESSHVPMTATVLEPMKDDYPPGPYTHGPQNGYKKVEWIVKKLDN